MLIFLTYEYLLYPVSFQPQQQRHNHNQNQTHKTRGGRFRQTGMFGSNIIVGAVLGIISGKYIFEEPLQRYWAEKAAEEAALQGSTDSASGSGEKSS